MWFRCTNPKAVNYKKYGGSGITVCDRWLSFENFLEDMGERPPGLSLDRKNNDLGYEMGNCQWSTRLDQTLNRSNTVWIEINGRRQCLFHWCKEFGIRHQTVLWRVRNKGMSFEAALQAPVR